MVQASPRQHLPQRNLPPPPEGHYALSLAPTASLSIRVTTPAPPLPPRFRSGRTRRGGFPAPVRHGGLSGAHTGPTRPAQPRAIPAAAPPSSAPPPWLQTRAPLDARAPREAAHAGRGLTQGRGRPNPARPRPARTAGPGPRPPRLLSASRKLPRRRRAHAQGSAPPTPSGRCEGRGLGRGPLPSQPPVRELPADRNRHRQ